MLLAGEIHFNKFRMKKIEKTLITKTQEVAPRYILIGIRKMSPNFAILSEPNPLNFKFDESESF